jgi:predicted outer membrane repeat protein
VPYNKSIIGGIIMTAVKFFRRFVKMGKKSGLIILLVVICGFSVFAQTPQRSYYVRFDGDDENNNGRSEEVAFKTLKKAVDMASKGAVKTITIIGTLTNESEGGRFSIQNAGPSEIIIIGKPDSDATLKLVNYSNSVVYITNSNVKFENIEITGGDSGQYGGGINIEGAIVTVGDGVKIHDNKAKSFGGGVSVGDNSTFTMTGGEIVNNTSNHQAGGLFSSGITILSGNARIHGNTVMGDGEYGGKGGGIYISKAVYSRRAEASCVISGNTNISGNMATQFGGGIYSELPFVLKENAIIQENKAKEGGGIYIKYRSNTLIMQDHVIVSNNQAVNGGGIYGNIATEITIMNASEVKNNTAEYGAGIYTRGKLTISGGKIVDNKAEFVGGGIYIATGGVYIKNGGSFSGNEAGDGEGENEFRQ